MNDIAYVGTGRTSATSSTLVQNFYKYDVTTNSWTEINSFPGIGRRGAVSFVIDEYAYIGSGESNGGVLGSFYRFDPSNETWLQVAFLPVPRTSSVAFSIDGYGYVGTGDLDPGSINDFWQYNPVSDVWVQKASVSSINRREAVGFALNGRGYIGTGGNGIIASLGDMWEYDPATDTWIQIEDFAGTARRYFSATTLNGFAFACMGTNGTNFKDLWLFDQALSLVERSLDQLEVVAYPNPSKDYIIFNVDWPSTVDQDNIKLRITDITGRLVFDALWSELTTINTSAWNPGNYQYSITYNDQLVRSENLIIQ